MPPPANTVKCYKCGGGTQPAALNPKALWCTLCAIELSPSGGPLITQPKEEAQAPGAEAAPEAAPALAAQGEPVASQARKSFHVRVGAVSFTSFDKVELDIAGTKVVIT